MQICSLALQMPTHNVQDLGHCCMLSAFGCYTFVHEGIV